METAAQPGPAAPERIPHPFSELPPLWLQLPHMDEQFFAAELPHTSNLNTFLSVLVYTAIGTVCVVLVALLRLIFNGSQSASALGIAMAVGACITLIGSPLSFYLNTGIYFVAAMIFGGKGTFAQQAYIHSLYFIPLAAVGALATFLQLLPRLGLFLSWLVLALVVLIDLFFQVRAFKVVHGFTTGRAAAAVLTPFLLIFGFICLSVGVIAALMVAGPLIGNTFSSINQSLLTPVP